MNERPGILLYWDTFEVLESLLDNEVKIMLIAIRDYARTGTIPDFKGNRVLSTLWVIIQQRLDADEQRYKDICVKRVQAGKKGAERKKQMPANASKCQQVLPSESNEEQNKPITIQFNSNSNSNNKRFCPPTLDEIKIYCEERHNNIDAERFFDYYSANGWVQGKGTPIKDWKACVRTWERNTDATNRITDKKENPFAQYGGVLV